MLVASKIRLRVSLLVAMVAGAPAAFAALPEVADRVPANAHLVVTLDNLGSFMSQMSAIEKLFGQADADRGPLAGLEMFGNAKGVKKDGAVAMVIMPGADGKPAMEEGQSPPMVVFVPVTDYAAFVAGFEGQVNGAISTLMVDGTEAFAKDIGGGYALMSDQQGLLESFPAEAKGQREGHLARAGARGREVIERSNLVVLADVQGLKPALEQGVQQMKDQAEAMSGMMGGMGGGMGDEDMGEDAAEDSAKVFDQMSEAFMRDGRTIVGGISLAGGHLALHIGAQFLEGTQMAGTFAGAGNAAPILNRLPATPFILAYAADTSSPQFREIMQDMQKMQEESGMGEINRLMSNMAEGSTGNAFIMGFNPMALMGGGLFINSAAFNAVNDTAAFMTSSKEAMLALNGKETEVGTFATTYEADAVEVSGVKVAKTTMKIEPGMDSDPMVGQMMAMMMGPTQQIEMLSAPVEGGIVTALSNNPPLLASAIDAAKGGNNLGKDAGIKTVRELLPGNRVMEAYLGTKSVLDSVSPMLAMFGMGDELDVPGSMNPMGFAMTSGEGGMSLSMVIPSDNLKAFADIAKQMQAMQGGDMGGDEDEGGAPAF